MTAALIEDRLRALLGSRFAAAAAPPAEADDALFPEERRAIARAGRKRRAEFATVRLCARRALAELGVPPRPLVPSSGGASAWPAGVIGSLSHTDAMCAAAAARASSALALGIDLEPDTPLEAELETLVCTAAERAWIRGQPPRLRGALGKLVFSAKEAFYKCQYGLTGAFLDFPDVEIEIDLQAKAFRVVRTDGVETSMLPAASILGRFDHAGDHVITVAVLEAAALAEAVSEAD